MFPDVSMPLQLQPTITHRHSSDGAYASTSIRTIVYASILGLADGGWSRFGGRGVG